MSNWNPNAVLKSAGIDVKKLSAIPKIAQAKLALAHEKTRDSGRRVLCDLFDDKRGFACTPFSACIGRMLAITNKDDAMILYYVEISLGTSDFGDQTWKTIVGNASKWNRPSVRSGKKSYTSDFKLSDYFASADFAPIFKLIEKRFGEIKTQIRERAVEEATNAIAS